MYDPIEGWVIFPNGRPHLARLTVERVSNELFDLPIHASTGRITRYRHLKLGEDFFHTRDEAITALSKMGVGSGS